MHRLRAPQLLNLPCTHLYHNNHLALSSPCKVLAEEFPFRNQVWKPGLILYDWSWKLLNLEVSHGNINRPLNAVVLVALLGHWPSWLLFHSWSLLILIKTSWPEVGFVSVLGFLALLGCFSVDLFVWSVLRGFVRCNIYLSKEPNFLVKSLNKKKNCVGLLFLSKKWKACIVLWKDWTWSPWFEPLWELVVHVSLC